MKRLLDSIVDNLHAGDQRLKKHIEETLQWGHSAWEVVVNNITDPGSGPDLHWPQTFVTRKHKDHTTMADVDIVDKDSTLEQAIKQALELFIHSSCIVTDDNKSWDQWMRMVEGDIDHIAILGNSINLVVHYPNGNLSVKMTYLPSKDSDPNEFTPDRIGRGLKFPHVFFME